MLFRSTGFTGSVNVINQTATLTTSWQRFTFTGTVGATATQLGFYFQGGASGTAGANDWYEVTGVQLEVGAIATPFQTASGGSIQGELAMCQRYYWRSTTGNPIQTQAALGYSWAYLTTATQAYLQFPVTMRANASTTADYSSLQVQDIATGTWTTPTAVTYNSTTQFGAQVLFTGMAGLTNYRQYAIGPNGNNLAYIAFSAEL